MHEHDSRARFAAKLALGTVQFGLDYGISNAAGQVGFDTAVTILERAADWGLDTLDTAVGYGNSEEVIGRVLATRPYGFELISKFPGDTEADSFDAVLEGTLTRLGTNSIKAYLAHTFEAFTRPELRERLAGARDRGLIEQIGVSVYHPAEIRWLLERDIDVDLIQCPFSLFDQRFREVFAALKERGVEIHVRSAFLQGLFFLAPDELPTHFQGVSSKLAALRELCETAAIPLGALLLDYAVMQPEIDKVVFGVQSPAELEQNLAAHRHLGRCETLSSSLDSFAETEEAILLPSLWP